MYWSLKAVGIHIPKISKDYSPGSGTLRDDSMVGTVAAVGLNQPKNKKLPCKK
jgi:hypothetical protein